MMLGVVHNQLVEIKGALNYLLTRDFVRTKDPRKLTLLELEEAGKALGSVHPDLLESLWLPLLDGDVERREALLAGVDKSGEDPNAAEPSPPPEIVDHNRLAGVDNAQGILHFGEGTHFDSIEDLNAMRPSHE